MKVAPKQRAGASLELIPLCPEYIVQSKCQKGAEIV
jgi:hypothetical protein